MQIRTTVSHGGQARAGPGGQGPGPCARAVMRRPPAWLNHAMYRELGAASGPGILKLEQAGRVIRVADKFDALKIGNGPPAGLPAPVRPHSDSTIMMILVMRRDIHAEGRDSDLKPSSASGLQRQQRCQDDDAPGIAGAAWRELLIPRV